MKILPLYALSSAMLLSACNVGALARVNPHAVAVYRAPADCPLAMGLDDTEAGSVNLDCFRFDKDDGRTAYQMATAADATQAAVARNRLAAVLVTHADNVCVLEKGRIVGREAALNFGLSSATSALSVASSIVGGEVAKSILAGGASVTNAVRGHANESFYRNQVTQAITASMDTERERLAKIIDQRRSQTIAEYSADDMIRLANQYHQACSFERGLQLLVKAAVNQRGIDVILAQRNAASTLNTLDQELRSVNAELATAVSAERRAALETRRTQIEQARDVLLGIGSQPPEEQALDVGAGGA